MLQDLQIWNFFSSIFKQEGKENIHLNVIINLISIYEIEKKKGRK